jgi:hypothetical protein
MNCSLVEIEKMVEKRVRNYCDREVLLSIRVIIPLRGYSESRVELYLKPICIEIEEIVKRVVIFCKNNGSMIWVIVKVMLIAFY